MATDYEIFYRNNPNGLGKPTAQFVSFFEKYNRPNARVLDVGCGQGRDAIFIAQLGHSVTAIDLSPTGISDLRNAAKAQRLNITTHVADIRNHEWKGTFDVIVIDRTLHMLDKTEQIEVLSKLITSTRSGSSVLIADEKANIPAFKTVFKESEYNWSISLEKGGFLFATRNQAENQT